MAESHHYEMTVSWVGASRGSTASYETYSREYIARMAGKPELHGSSDPVFRGDPKLHNPEDMLVLALSSCHLLSYLALCARARIEVLSYEDRATGVMSPKGKNTFAFTEVVLHPVVKLAPGSDVQKATDLHHTAHELCFIANSVNFPVRNE